MGVMCPCSLPRPAGLGIRSTGVLFTCWGILFRWESSGGFYSMVVPGDVSVLVENPLFSEVRGGFLL